VKSVTTVIVGAGQSGLAMSARLAERSIDHVVLERGEVANSWRKERWDSLRLLTPNWQSRLPGHEYRGADPHGYMDMREVVDFFDVYARTIAAPVETNTRVTSVRHAGSGYAVETDRGTWIAPTVVVASGACNIASVPKIAAALPASVLGLTPMQYRNPDMLPDGSVMVVGASASGVQLAKEIQASGRQVTLCVGEHVRAPRTYRGRDIQYWMDACGVLDMDYRQVDDLDRARRVPSLQLAGSHDSANVDLNALTAAGVRIVGRLVGLRDGKAQFSGSLANVCMLADLKMRRLLDTIDAFVAESGMADEVAPADPFEPTRLDGTSKLELDLVKNGIRSVIWATGYRPDHSWVEVPVFDAKGRVRHDGGVTGAPGLFVMGLPFLRRRKSTLIDGAGDDARDLADNLCAMLHRRAA